MSQKEVKQVIEFDENKFRERFIELREKHKMTQAEFASYLEIPTGSVGGYESGKKFPNGKTLFKIACKCEISADYLLGLQKEPTINEDMKMICSYTGLSETAVNRLHWILNHTNQKSISEIISFLIDPDGDTRIMNDLTYISGALYCYSKGYTELINNMRSHYDNINDLPIEKVKEISAYFAKETKVIKTDYNDVFDMFKKLVDDYVDTHIKTPEKVTIYKDFWQTISNREEDEQ